jgi:3-methyladenine DNA glycosylase AlkD
MLSTQIAELVSRLETAADESKQRWWTNYVKGAEFLGVPMAQTRSIALKWFRAGEFSDPVGLCLDLGIHPISEMKLAGIAIMEHVLVPNGDMNGADLERVQHALADGAYDDWNTCDWLCVKVIGRLVDGAPRTDHDRVLAWSSSNVLWEKRAGLVGFVNLLPQREPSVGFDRSFLATAATVVADDRRFAQTAAGWTLRELSHREPELVRDFVRDHGGLMSSEALFSATRFLVR